LLGLVSRSDLAPRISAKQAGRTNPMSHPQLEKTSMATKIVGHVVDNNRRPVANVKISFNGNVIGESGKDGFFSIKIPTDQDRLAITFAADRYVSNTRIFSSRVSGKNVIVIWPVAFRVRFDSTRDLDIELGSSRIQIPANALVRPGGKKISGGGVELRFTLLDVTSRFQRSACPGDFSGQLSDGSLRRLNSYGIFDFDLRNLKGGLLSLQRGAKIDLSIPVPRRLVRQSPRQVGFFRFDQVSGIWIQVSDFTFNPGTLTYNGSINQFGGAHNLDEAQDTTCVTVQVINDLGEPMPDMSVTAHGLQYDSHGTTNADGFVCLLVQKNAPFTVSANGTLGGSGYSTPPGFEPTFTSPNFSSGAGDCGNPVLCPLLGTVLASLIVSGGGINLPDEEFPSPI
jgi:hypothetical protein